MSDIKKLKLRSSLCEENKFVDKGYILRELNIMVFNCPCQYLSLYKIYIFLKHTT